MRGLGLQIPWDDIFSTVRTGIENARPPVYATPPFIPERPILPAFPTVESSGIDTQTLLIIGGVALVAIYMLARRGRR